MKTFKFFLFIIAFLLPFSTLALTYRTELVRMGNVDNANHNMVVDRGREGKWLLHYQTPCFKFKEGDLIRLEIGGDFDTGDRIRVNFDRACDLTRVEKVTGTLFIEKVDFGKRSGVVRDEAGRRFDVYVNNECTQFNGYRQSTAYIEQFGPVLSVNDRLQLPDNEVRCYFTYVSPVQDQSSGLIVEKPIEKDVKRPATVPHVRAIPGKDWVYVNWQPAQDNVGVDHYILSWSPYHIDTKYREDEGMPNQIKTDRRGYKITGLASDELYFFYVVAVDAAGNMSSDWSNEATASTKSAIHTALSDGALPAPVTLRHLQETSHSILFSWNQVPGLTRQVVTLRADDQVLFSLHDWPKKTIRISKSAERKGKNLELHIRQYDVRSNPYEDTFTFRF